MDGNKNKIINKEEEIFICKIKKSQYYDKVRKTSVRGIAYQNDYYKIDSLPWDDLGNDEKAYIVEKRINQSFENDIPKYWKLFSESNNSISINEKYRIVQIILHLKLRNPFIRNDLYTKEKLGEILDLESSEIKNISDDSWIQRKEELGEAYESYIDFVFDLWKAAIAEKGGRVLHNRILAYTDIKETKAKSNAIWKLVQSNWTILETKSHPFIVSDNPGFTIVGNQVYNLMISGKFEFYFPINSSKILRVGNRKNTIDLESLTEITHEYINEERVLHLNNQTMLHANLEIYSDNKFSIEKHRGIYYKQFNK